MQINTPKSVWSRYCDHAYEIRQYCFGTDPEHILKNIDTEAFLEGSEHIAILRMLGLHPGSMTVWIGINTEPVTLMGHTYRPGCIFAGDGREPHTRFAVIDGWDD
jgi:hypothetical protein